MESLWYIIILVIIGSAFLVGFLRENGVPYFKKKVHPEQCLKSLLTSAIFIPGDSDHSQIDFIIDKEVRLDEIPLQDLSRACKILNYICKKLSDSEMAYPTSITLSQDAGKYFLELLYPEDPTHSFLSENKKTFSLNFQLEKVLQWGKRKKIKAIWRQVIAINQNINYISPS